MPRGRGGAGGTSPAAIRSVQSANIASARFLPSWFTVASIAPPACPDWMRRSQAATDVAKWPKVAGSSRVPLVPN